MLYRLYSTMSESLRQRIMSSSSNAAGPASQPPTSAPGSALPPEPKKKSRRSHRFRRRHRRSSFIANEELSAATESENHRNHRPPTSPSATRDSFYRLSGERKSSESIDSLLDHRDAEVRHQRRQSLHQRSRPSKNQRMNRSGNLIPDIESSEPDDRTPLLTPGGGPPPSMQRRKDHGWSSAKESQDTVKHSSNLQARLTNMFRRSSHSSSVSSNKLEAERSRSQQHLRQDDLQDEEFDVNNPPSMPNTPKLDSVKLPDYVDSVYMDPQTGDTIVPIDQDHYGFPETGDTQGGNKRRMTLIAAEDDVCFPQDLASEIGEEDERRGFLDQEVRRRKGRRRKAWPDIDFLEAWRRQENSDTVFDEAIRARKMTEPLLVDGRLRPRKVNWHREQEDAPYRFTYFNEDFESTIHSHTISELVQPEHSFEDLFNPKPPIISESSTDEDEGTPAEFERKPTTNSNFRSPISSNLRPLGSMSIVSDQSTGQQTPQRFQSPPPNGQKDVRYGPKPLFWLDILRPTETEMKVIAKAFGIHPLTTEDIMTQEEREKVELFRNYYFVNYRSFEQDRNSEDYLEPVNMYVVVFRDGILSFHFSQTPHPANVRRRIRQLNDYLFLTPDWISYALIDDITDAYAPLIEAIEEEVDLIDESILDMHSMYNEEAVTGKESSAMLRNVGDCRKKVMGLYRLLGNKADVIKGFAKKCNEQWEVAPRSDIGLYLGDIQDHIVTMTQNLSHYENLLSRAHSNYLTQINLRMNERAEKTNDVLGKLTVLGTIVLPMNIVTGLFGMNTRVPGENGHDGDLTWFWTITAGLLLCGLLCFIISRIYLRVL